MLPQSCCCCSMSAFTSASPTTFVACDVHTATMGFVLRDFMTYLIFLQAVLADILAQVVAYKMGDATL